MLNVRQVAKKLGISVRTVWYWVETNPDFPKGAKLGPRARRWTEAEIDAYVESTVEGFVDALREEE